VLEGGNFLPQKHQNILLNLFDLESITVEDAMTPRIQIEAIDIESSPDEIRRQIATSNHTRLPVYRGRRGHPTLFPFLLAPEVFRLRPDQGLNSLLKNSQPFRSRARIECIDLEERRAWRWDDGRRNSRTSSSRPINFPSRPVILFTPSSMNCLLTPGLIAGSKNSVSRISRPEAGRRFLPAFTSA